MLVNNNIELEKNELTLKNIPVSLPVIFSASLIICYILLNRVSHSLLIPWFISLNAVMLIRLVLYLLYKFSKKIKSYRNIFAIFYLLLFLNSFLLGAASFFIPVLDESWAQIVILFVLAALALGSLSAMTAKKLFALTFILLTLSPSFFIFLSIDRPLYKYVSIMIFLFILYLFNSLTKINRIIVKSLETRDKYDSAINELKIIEERFITIFNGAPVGIFYFSKDLRVIESNEMFTEILKIPMDAVMNMDLNSINDKRVFPSIQQALNGKDGFYEGEYITTYANDSIWVILRTAPIEDKSGSVVGGVGIVEDMTEVRQIREKLNFRHYHDPLTELPNRALLSDRLNMALLRANRNNHIGALFILDLNRFKTINDTLGHKTGDQIIKRVSERIQNTIRKEDTLSRFGSDEFVILLPELSKNYNEAVIQAKVVSEKILNNLQEPFEIKGQIIHTDASIGISLFPVAGLTPDDIIKNADVAMNEAKRFQDVNVCFYDMEINDQTKKRLNLEKDLRQAIINNEFENYYQPIVETLTGEITGAEVLIRWNHPVFGFVYPDEFIDIAEETGIIIQMGEWSLENLVNQIKAWDVTELNTLSHIGLNLSVKQFRNEDFIESMRKIFSENKDVAKKLVLEFTESIMIDNYEKTIAKMKKLKSLGVRFAIDDFGTGYSSLSYLKKIPIDVLKIDRAFIMDVLDDPDDAAITQTMIDIGSHFNLMLIAEGVETKDHVDYLKKHNCQYYQGYYCSKPLKKTDFEKLVIENHKKLAGV